WVTASADRPAGWTGTSLLRSPAAITRAYPGREAAGARGDERDTVADACGASRDCRVCAGLRSKLGVGPWRTERYACRDHRQAQWGDQRDGRRTQDKGGSFESGWDGALRLAGRVRQAHG